MRRSSPHLRSEPEALRRSDSSEAERRRTRRAIAAGEGGGLSAGTRICARGPTGVDGGSKMERGAAAYKKENEMALASSLHVGEPGASASTARDVAGD